MDIAFLVPRPDKPSTKFRILSYLPLLSEAGVRTSVFSLSRNAISRWKALLFLGKYDVVMIQKKLLSLVELFLIRQVAKRIVYDFDDAVMFKGSENMNPALPQRHKRFERTIRLCDWNIAGNDYLKKEASLFSQRISVLPTPVDTDKYIPREKHAGPEGVTIGWIGSKSTTAYLIPLFPVFLRLKTTFPQARIKVVSDRFEAIGQAIGIEKVQWEGKEEIAALQSFDIGLMPLPDDPWTRGKCGFKLLQYQAMGIPVVCSSVGINKTIVNEGVNGFFAHTNEEWFDRVSRLVISPDLRARMGKAGRRIVTNEYSLKSLWPRFFSIIKKVVTLR